MSKELRAFRKICKNLNSYEFDDEYKKGKKLIETALKRLERINTIPHSVSKELGKPLKDNKRFINSTIECENIKALKIIKEKMVIPAYIINTKNVEEYNKWLKQDTFRKEWLKRMLTQEEYDLLKEVLL